jgi:hypothetical protein
MTKTRLMIPDAETTTTNGAGSEIRRRILAAMEHAAYLRPVRPSSLNAGRPLDFLHQTLLRLSVLHRAPSGPVADLVTGYCTDLERRGDILRHLIRLLPAPDPSWEDGRVTKYASTPGRYVDEFSSTLGPDAPVAFANDHGFGHFDVPPGPLAPQVLPLSLEVSVGGLSFYGFSTPTRPEIWFLQALPIEVLAATLTSVAGHGFAGAPDDWTLSGMMGEFADEVRDLGDGPAAAEALRQACTECFWSHEVGHRLDPTRAPQTTALLHRHLASLGDAREFHFPDAHRLASWHRVHAAATPRASDVVFLYGDLVANVAAVEGGLSAAATRVLRAYNWRYVPPGGPPSRPRGNVAFLAAGADAVGQGLELIDDVLTKPPSRWAERMRFHERRSWALLRRRVARRAGAGRRRP